MLERMTVEVTGHLSAAVYCQKIMDIDHMKQVLNS